MSLYEYLIYGALALLAASVIVMAVLWHQDAREAEDRAKQLIGAHREIASLIARIDELERFLRQAPLRRVPHRFEDMTVVNGKAHR